MNCFRFGIRDLIWAMVVVSIFAAWWAERRQAEVRYDSRDPWKQLSITGSRHARRRPIERLNLHSASETHPKIRSSVADPRAETVSPSGL